MVLFFQVQIQLNTAYNLQIHVNIETNTSMCVTTLIDL